MMFEFNDLDRPLINSDDWIKCYLMAGKKDSAHDTFLKIIRCSAILAAGIVVGLVLAAAVVLLT